MTNNPLHDNMLANLVDMLALYQERLKAIREVIHAYERSTHTTKELIRAVSAGDKNGIAVLAPIVGKGVGATRPFYDGIRDELITNEAVKRAQQWRASYEQEKQTDPVPALQDGALSD